MINKMVLVFHFLSMIPDASDNCTMCDHVVVVNITFQSKLPVQLAHALCIAPGDRQKETQRLNRR